MNALEVSQRSLDAWNRHDADAIVALYAEGGTNSAPRAGQALTGQAIAKMNPPTVSRPHLQGV